MFNDDFARSQRRFNIMFTVISWTIGLVFVAIVAFWIFAGTLIFKATDQVQSQGLKSTIERIWCGPDNHCL